jgi:hypothetical protein
VLEDLPNKVLYVFGRRRPTGHLYALLLLYFQEAVQRMVELLADPPGKSLSEESVENGSSIQWGVRKQLWKLLRSLGCALKYGLHCHGGVHDRADIVVAIDGESFVRELAQASEVDV